MSGLPREEKPRGERRRIREREAGTPRKTPITFFILSHFCFENGPSGSLWGQEDRSTDNHQKRSSAEQNPGICQKEASAAPRKKRVRFPPGSAWVIPAQPDPPLPRGLTFLLGHLPPLEVCTSSTPISTKPPEFKGPLKQIRVAILPLPCPTMQEACPSGFTLPHLQEPLQMC